MPDKPNFSRSQLLLADWPAPANVHAMVTSRKQGHSHGNFAGFNLADHVGDEPDSVMQNRRSLQQLLEQEFALRQQPFWLNQTHSTHCVAWQNKPLTLAADASYSNQAGQACVVMTADCLPLLLTNRQGSWVAACHAGWRGLANGVIENTLKCYTGDKADLIAWIGPAISTEYFEVGEDVRTIFIKKSADFAQFFDRNNRNRYQFDYIALAQRQLSAFGIQSYGGNLCSYADAERFYSYRRDGQTGRMASLIWFE